MLDEKVEEYCEFHTTPETDLLKKIFRETNLKVLNPRMLSGHLQGKLLEFFSILINPEQILEIGTFTGYSAICLAKGLKKDGVLHTIEKNIELEDIILKNFNRAGIIKNTKLYIGNALDVIPEINKKFDLIFIDADKINLLNYYNFVFEKLNNGGLIIVDNVLWNKKVIEKIKPNDADTKAIKKFNDFVQNDERVENLMLPIRDGLMLIIKK
ncbi:MAG: O-methyltransferase [Bacteroidales bacterium]|nr:O-methyltransferase [Bacteroidales bacterium]